MVLIRSNSSLAYRKDLKANYVDNITNITDDVNIDVYLNYIKNVLQQGQNCLNNHDYKNAYISYQKFNNLMLKLQKHKSYALIKYKNDISILRTKWLEIEEILERIVYELDEEADQHYLGSLDIDYDTSISAHTNAHNMNNNNSKEDEEMELIRHYSYHDTRLNERPMSPLSLSNATRTKSISDSIHASDTNNATTAKSNTASTYTKNNSNSNNINNTADLFKKLSILNPETGVPDTIPSPTAPLTHPTTTTTTDKLPPLTSSSSSPRQSEASSPRGNSMSLFASRSYPSSPLLAGRVSLPTPVERSLVSFTANNR